VAAVIVGDGRPAGATPAAAKESFCHPLALSTRMETGPRAASASATTAAGAAGSVRSALIATERRP
jgi:hypothetical protein